MNMFQKPSTLIGCATPSLSLGIAAATTRAQRKYGKERSNVSSRSGLALMRDQLGESSNAVLIGFSLTSASASGPFSIAGHRADRTNSRSAREALRESAGPPMTPLSVQYL